MLVPRYRPPDLPLGALFGGRSARDAFEARVAGLVEVPHAIATSSARASLVAVLRALGVGPGDEVVIPSLTAACVPRVLRDAGYRVRIAAICPARWVMTAESLDAARSPRSRAVIPTHLEGAIVDMAAITELARGRGMTVVEDAAHAFGAPVSGDAAVYSLGRGKHFGLPGGAIVATQDPDLAAVLRARPRRASSRLLRRAAQHLALRVATTPALFRAGPLRLGLRFGVDLPTIAFENERAATFDDVPSWLWSAAFARLPVVEREQAWRATLAAERRDWLSRQGIAHQHGAPRDRPLWIAVLEERRVAAQKAWLARGIDTQPTWMRSVIDDEGRRDEVADRIARQGLYLPWAAALPAMVAGARAAGGGRRR